MSIPTTIDDPAMTLVYILIVIIITSIVTRLIAFSMNKMNRFKKNMTVVYLIRDLIKIWELKTMYST